MKRTRYFPAICLAAAILLTACAAPHDPSVTDRDTSPPYRPAESAESPTVPASTACTDSLLTPAEEPLLRKLLFAIRPSETETVKSEDELDAAIEVARQAVEGKPAEAAICLTICYVANPEEDEAYRAIAAERGNQETSEEVRAWRERLNEASRAYHEKLVDTNRPLLEELGYTQITHTPYLPMATVQLTADELEACDLCMIARAEAVMSVTVEVVGMRQEPVPEG